MGEEWPSAERREAIDERLEAALPPAGGSPLAPAREVMLRAEDRRYGRLLVASYRSYGSLPGARVPEPIPSAAAAVELLRGYCRLRERLLNRVDGVSPSDRAPMADLLAADYLYTAAYSSLVGVDDDGLTVCVGMFTDVLNTIVETFDAAYARPSPAIDHATYVDGTAGALGWGAAGIGATLAGADDAPRSRFADYGRGFATAYRIRLILASDDGTAYPSAATPDDRLRRYAIGHFGDAEEALERLSAGVDTDPLRTLLGTATPARVSNDPID